MRFRDEFAVEWIRNDGSSVQSEPTRSEEVAESCARWLNEDGHGLAPRVITRTVREERDHWWHPWRTTGVSKWFEWGELADGSPIVEIDPAV